MKSIRRNTILSLLLIARLLSGCFEEDLRVVPHEPGDELTFEMDQSIYTHQLYFDLGSNSIRASNENGAWLLRFSAQAGDRHIGINSAGYWGVYPTGTADPDSIPPKPPAEEWIFDHSDGDPDSSAFAGWVSFTGEDTLYTGHIYLIGQYDGAGYRASWAARFLHVDENLYRFRIKAWPSGEWEEYEIPKSPDLNYRYFSPAQGGTFPDIEPDREAWDLLFTQYGTILYTDEGVPTPYYVRGVWLNRYAVQAAVDTVRAFPEITFRDLDGYAFTTRQDAIGYEWKDVEVDVNSGSAVYTVNPGIIYIIRDTEGFYHKLRFTGFYNNLGEKGYPAFEHSRL